VRTKSSLRAWGYDEKIVVAHPDILIAWAGVRSAAERIIRGVAEYFSDKPVSLFFVEAYIHAEHELALKDVSLIVSVQEANRGASWSHNCSALVVPYIGTVWLGGSGADRAKKYLTQTAGAISKAENSLIRGIACALITGGSLLADEMRTGETLVHDFGGAYEVASFVNRKATKIEDFAFLFWFGAQQPDGGYGFNFPQKVMRKYERNGQTCYYCLEFDVGVNPMKVTKEEVFIWKQFLAPTAVPHGVAELPQLNTQWQINIFCADQLSGTPTIIGQLGFHENRSGHLITFDESNKRKDIGLGFSQEELRQVLLPLVRK